MIFPDSIHSFSVGAMMRRFFASPSTKRLISLDRAPRDNSAKTTALQGTTNLRSRISYLKRPERRILMYTDVSRIARLATVKVAGPRLAAEALNQLAVFLGFNDRFQGHLDGLSSALCPQNPLRRSHQPVIKTK
jgi:hypothetical protein